VLSLGQFNQWVGQQLMMSGAVQIWPAMPIAEPIFDDGGVSGVRLLDQGVDSTGFPTDSFTPGMDIHAALTVVADGPVGAVGRAIDKKFGMPPEHARSEWAVGMKMVIDLPESADLEPGTVFHTIGYPEPKSSASSTCIRTASPPWASSCPPGSTRPSARRTAICSTSCFIRSSGIRGRRRMRSWGAKTLMESGRRGEPYLAGDGWARIGEGSGSTKRADRLRRRRSLDHRRFAGRVRFGTAA